VLLMKALILAVLLCAPAWATTFYVNASTGSSSNTCTQAQTSSTPKDTITHGIACMGTADTLVVYAGTYSESPTVTAGGGSGSYNTVTVHASDIVSVLGFTLNSHTQLIGNCPTLQGTVTTATCGFFISNTASPSSACVSLPNNTTDVYIRKNVMYACGSIGPGYPTQTSYIYVQGNTISYTNSTIATVPTTCGGSGSPVGNSLNLYGNHYLIENNDFSHYTISLNLNPENSITRNNNFHDTSEVNNAGNCHSDTWFSDPGGTNLVTNEFNVYEGNDQYNAVGPNAKGTLFQAPSCTGCAYAITRYNVCNGLGSGNTTNDQNWISVKNYNNTCVDASYLAGAVNGETDNSSDSNPPQPSFLNNIYYYGLTAYTSINPYACGNSNSCNYGHNLAYCVQGCGTLYGHVYQSGTFLGDTGNQVADPKFVSYVATYGSNSSNFHLQATSPAVAAGVYLTTVGSGDAGSGTTLTLTDSSYFQDGYGLTNAYSTVSGDCIAVTTVSNTVCITAVNYSGNTVTLASGITRSVGDHVWLYSKSDGVRVLTGSAPDLGAFPFTSGAASFTVSPATIPSYHSGNIQIAITGSGTSWTSGTTFSAGSPCTFVSSTVNAGAQTGTVTVTTSSTTGSCTVTDSTDSATASVTVANPLFSISPTSGTPGSGGCTTACQGTVTFTGTNTVWANPDQSSSGLFTLSGGTGASLGTITVVSNTSATATLTWGSASGTLTLTDTSNGNSLSNTQSFTVQANTTPTVTTGTAGSFTPSGAVITGNSYTCTGSCTTVTSEGTCYSVNANPTTPCTSNGTTSPWNSTLSGLASATTYHFRAFATNSVGTAYGADTTFTTPIISYIKGAGNNGSTASSTWTFSYTASTINDAVVFAIFCNNGTSPATSATLTASGWTTTQLIAPVSNGTGAGVLFGAFAPNTSSSTFTAGFGSVACSSFYGYMIAEFQGNITSSLAAAFPVQGSSGGTSTSTGCNQTSAGVTPLTNNNAVWNACFGAPTGVALPWTAGAADGGGGDLSEYQLLSGNPGSQIPSYTGTTGVYVVLGTSISPLGPPTPYGPILAQGFMTSTGQVTGR
jgi:hypothetical protein